METCVLIPQELALVVVPSGANILYEQLVSVWSKKEIEKGTLLYPFQGTIRIDKLDTYSKVNDDDVSINLFPANYIIFLGMTR
jgi:hypothetical protein